MAAPNKVFFVHLRRPGPNDPRTDPLYEFGSFGCTKCHHKNLFHPRHAEDLKGSRLAFAQGGDDGFRMVFLTPPITVKVWANNCEARWVPAEMPFQYRKAPVLVANDGRSDFPLVKALANEANRSTLEGGLSSRIRSLSRPLPANMAKQLISVYERYRKVNQYAIAGDYFEALPYFTAIDSKRKATYDKLLNERQAEIDGKPIRRGDRVVSASIHSRSHCQPMRDRDTRTGTKRCT